MADVNNKLRLQIVTQLDAAGIKATKDQVDQLELGLRRAGNTGTESSEKFGRLEKALGSLPGPFGKIGSAMGGIAAKATMAFGAFSMGVEIGNKLVAVMKDFGILPDAMAEHVKQTKAYNAELASLKSTLDEVVAAELKRMDVASANAEKNIKAIDDQTAAYFRQASALEGLRKSGGNAELIQLERQKFEEMRAYAEGVSPEAAEQIGKYYDVLIAEEQAKQNLAQFDRESVKLTKELTSAEESYQRAAERAAQAKAKQASAEEELKTFREKFGVNGEAVYKTDMEAARDDALEKIAERAKKDAEKADAVLAKRSQRLENVDAELLQRQMDRANIAASGTLAVDRAAAAYDDYTASANNPGNFQIDPNWANDLLQKTIEADNNQRAILDEVKAFGDRLERLLEIK